MRAKENNAHVVVDVNEPRSITLDGGNANHDDILLVQSLSSLSHQSMEGEKEIL